MLWVSKPKGLVASSAFSSAGFMSIKTNIMCKTFFIKISITKLLYQVLGPRDSGADLRIAYTIPTKLDCFI